MRNCNTVLGIAGFHTQDKAENVIRRLKAAIDQADDPVEAYTVLTRAYLNLDKPDLEAALDANLKLRNLPQASEEALAPARLLGGELELRLKRPDLARRVLEKVGRPGDAGNSGQGFATVRPQFSG